MAIEATGSKHGKNSGFIIALVCVLVGGYCLYDGWLNEEFQQNHITDGKPDVTLNVNRIWLPITCLIVAAYSVISATRVGGKKIVASEEGLSFSGGQTIAYSNIKQIDKRYFDKEGHFILSYKEADTDKRLKLSGRKYDNLGMLLDELIRRTGATAPADASEGTEKEPEKS